VRTRGIPAIWRESRKGGGSGACRSHRPLRTSFHPLGGHAWIGGISVPPASMRTKADDDGHAGPEERAVVPLFCALHRFWQTRSPREEGHTDEPCARRISFCGTGGITSTGRSPCMVTEAWYSSMYGWNGVCRPCWGTDSRRNPGTRTPCGVGGRMPAEPESTCEWEGGGC